LRSKAILLFSATAPSTISKRNQEFAENPKEQIAETTTKTTDSSGVLIALIIVVEVLLTIALLVWGWYWLFWSVLYY
ncbi:MAG: hypothetical protein J6X43_02675, partial [Bacteroidales bacterium]|nr:hypothetical protein [Bacteroidales bacterium]